MCDCMCINDIYLELQIRFFNGFFQLDDEPNLYMGKWVKLTISFHEKFKLLKFRVTQVDTFPGASGAPRNGISSWKEDGI